MYRLLPALLLAGCAAQTATVPAARAKSRTLRVHWSATPFDTMTTVTYQIVQMLTGDQEFNSPKTLSAFALGLVLFIVTLVLNIIALRVVKKFREAYD